MTTEKNKKNISIMGSTGSIGTQTLDIVRRFPERFRVVALTANSNWELLAKQALEFHAKVAVVADPKYYTRLEEALKGTDIQPLMGAQALEFAATLPETDIVVGALVGYSGLASNIAAIKAGKTLALANKETLVVAGEIISALVKENGKPILPVDSEHSAIFQCLAGEDRKRMRKIILTASGGPFRKCTPQELETVTVEQTLAHPNWNMGSKVTVDSATMMNKGFEMIEAKWLFDCTPRDIEVVVHPQSIIHSMVEFADGSVKAQLGVPDMRIPIGYALGYPERLDNPASEGPDFFKIGELTFEAPDTSRFPLLRTAYEVIEQGGTAPAVLNAANEVAVRAFLEGRLTFNGIYRLVDETLNKISTSENVTLESIRQAHNEATAFAENIINGN